MSTSPFVHRLIAASAGSGKTFELTNRYLALLAAGIAPERIVATTFTRKAAGEILDRILERLAAAASSAQCAVELAGQLGTSNCAQAEFVSMLRRLLRELQHVRVGTLDRFNIALAGNRSLDVDLPAAWSICDEAEEALLRQEALDSLLEREGDKIIDLVALLNKGESKRSIHSELLQVVADHYETYLSSNRSAWNALRVPMAVSESTRSQAIAKLRAVDQTICGNPMLKARNSDLERFEAEDWQEFLKNGIAGKLHAGETNFSRKEIPLELREPYEALLQHARTELVRKTARQTEATWELLDHFHRDLWALKQASGSIRFHEVTHAIVRALAPAAETVAHELDGAIEHLLLDEFQDTSLPQWEVLRPFAKLIVQAPAKARRSFFCVGDIKQAIYGWRGGMVEILTALKTSLGAVQEDELTKSQRSAQPIIDVVNKVFGNLKYVETKDKSSDGLVAWSKRFQTHSTAKSGSGYVALLSGPAQGGMSLDEQRVAHCEYVAAQIKELVRRIPGRSIGILCRSNRMVMRMIYELRKLEIEASEEGGNPLTDSHAVEVILSLLKLSDHPGHSIAWFHLKHSPLAAHLASFADADDLARHLRRQRLTDGLGAFVRSWAMKLAPACDARELGRLQQLVGKACAFEGRSALRAATFVTWIQNKKVEDPRAACVRAMTIHAAKGLQFDVAVLPELDCALLGQAPSLVVGHDAASLNIDFVSRYAAQAVQSSLPDEARRVFEEDRCRRVEEALSTLYVAMTRPARALYMYVPGPRSRASDDNWWQILQQTLAADVEPKERSTLYEHGAADWYNHVPAPESAPVVAQRQDPIRFQDDQTGPRRGLEHIAPSRPPDAGRVEVGRLMERSASYGRAAGTLYHAWFAAIEWLDGGAPSDDALRAMAAEIRNDLPGLKWSDLDRYVRTFRSWLQQGEVAAVLRRSAYELTPQSVERERRFLVREGNVLLDGEVDRVVWLGDGSRILAADVVDFKTDSIALDDNAALAECVAQYRPQMAAYCRAIAKLGQLPLDKVSARLVFPVAGRVVETQ